MFRRYKKIAWKYFCKLNFRTVSKSGNATLRKASRVQEYFEGNHSSVIFNSLIWNKIRYFPNEDLFSYIPTSCNNVVISNYCYYAISWIGKTISIAETLRISQKCFNLIHFFKSIWIQWLGINNDVIQIFNAKGEWVILFFVNGGLIIFTNSI